MFIKFKSILRNVFDYLICIRYNLDYFDIMFRYVIGEGELGFILVC